MSLFYVAVGSTIGFEQANLPLEMQTALFSAFTIAAVLLTAYILMTRFPRLGDRFAQGMQNMIKTITGHKREARLNKIICYHCNKGMGLYNPVYFMSDGEQHIKGTCSLCGGHVSVRLN